MTDDIQTIDRKIAAFAVKTFINAGFLLGVNDGENTTITRSRNAAAILLAMFTTDQDRLLVYRHCDHKYFGWVLFIYGNTGWDVVNDYTENVEAVMVEVGAYAQEFEPGAREC